MNDEWLDAFDPEELDDPGLAEIDEAIRRIHEGLAAPAPARSRLRWPLFVAGALLLAAGVLLALQLVERPEPEANTPLPVEQLAPVEPEPIVGPEPVVEPDPEPVIAPEPPPAPVTAPPEPAPRPRAVQPVVQPPSETPEAPVQEPVPEKRPGLVRHFGSEVLLSGEHAVLVAGNVTYIHDATHEPGVTDVRFDSLPVTAVPVGTRFTVSTSAGLGAIAVSEGVVALVHDNGVRLGLVGAGGETAIVPDDKAENGVRLLDTSGRSIDAVASTVRRRERAPVVALVTGLRLQLLENTRPLPHTLPEDP